MSLEKVGLLAAYKLNKIPWPQKAEVATAPAPPPKDYRWGKWKVGVQNIEASDVNFVISLSKI